eukprot:4538546-Pleurochrysis_carterae.AAC.1
MKQRCGLWGQTGWPVERDGSRVGNPSGERKVPRSRAMRHGYWEKERGVGSEGVGHLREWTGGTGRRKQQDTEKGRKSRCVAAEGCVDSWPALTASRSTLFSSCRPILLPASGSRVA